MEQHPDTIPTVDEDTVSGVQACDLLAINNEEGITEMTLVVGVERLNPTTTRITVLRDNMEYQSCTLHKYELVRTGH